MPKVRRYIAVVCLLTLLSVVPVSGARTQGQEPGPKDEISWRVRFEKIRLVIRILDVLTVPVG